MDSETGGQRATTGVAGRVLGLVTGRDVIYLLLIWVVDG